MNWVDDRGFPGTQGEDGQYDGGDSAAIIGNLMALGAVESAAVIPGAIIPVKLRLLRSLIIKPDGMVRHPDKSKWYGQTDRFSRDQLIPILCSFVGSIPDADTRLVFRLHRARKFLTAWNTKKNGVMDTPDKFPDITGPEVWALWCRVLGGPWWLNLLLPILDLETLAGSISWRYFQPATNRVTRNHMLVCLTGMKKFPTVTMRLANWINNWPDLTARWAAHSKAVGEFPTADLFLAALKTRGDLS